MEPVVVSGTLDLQYVQDALARAHVADGAASYTTTPLTDGRTGASVTRLLVRAPGGSERAFVLKRVPPSSWRETLGADSTEARLWLAGATRSLPDGLRCPTIDVARDATGVWWLLMDDVASGIIPRGGFDEPKAHELMRNVARMHARYWGRDAELAHLPLQAFERTANGFALLSAHVARRQPFAEPWLAQMSDDFWVPRALVPVLLDALAPDEADFYTMLCSEHPRIAQALGRHPRTLCHGDLRRANISFASAEVALFDWELAAWAPAARDLQWYWLLQFWAYPPDDGRGPEDRGALVSTYLDALERELGSAIDRDSFAVSNDLAWLSCMCQIGCVLADSLASPSPTPDAVARAKRVIATAIARARRIWDHHVR